MNRRIRTDWNRSLSAPCVSLFCVTKLQAAKQALALAREVRDIDMIGQVLQAREFGVEG